VSRPPVPLTAGTVRAELGRRSCWFWGPDVRAAVEAVGAPSMYCPRWRGLTVPDDYVEQVIDWLQSECGRHVVRVVVDR
jgi:hypothetical protein